jgi:hypothetical protein
LAQPDSRESSPTFVPEAPAWRHLVAASPLWFVPPPAVGYKSLCAAAVSLSLPRFLSLLSMFFPHARASWTLAWRLPHFPAVLHILELRRVAQELHLIPRSFPVEGISPRLPKSPPPIAVSLQVLRSATARFAALRWHPPLSALQTSSRWAPPRLPLLPILFWPSTSASGWRAMRVYGHALPRARPT